MDPKTIQAEADRRLFQEIQSNDVIESIQRKMNAEGSSGVRRSLLAQALRLTPAIAPSVHKTLAHCHQTLQVQMEVELYVYPSPSFNAGCTNTEEGRVFVLLSSSLMEAFSEDELAFVVGHELGHHIYQHHEIPLPILLANKQHLPARLLLRAHTWQRYAEISADRAGMVCCGGLDPAARALFKLSSGLSTAPNDAEINAFIQQAEELYRENERDSAQQATHRDWLSSHPFSPIRLRAAQVFAESEPMVTGGTSMPNVELAVDDLMALMEASYLEEDSTEAEAMRRFLYAAGAVLAGADGEATREERDALASLLGEHIPSSLSPERLEECLPERLESVCKTVRFSRRAQLLRDLVIIARADGHIHQAEKKRLQEFAQGLSVPVSLVWETLVSPTELD